MSAKRPLYCTLLSPAERLDCMMTGSMLKAASEGIPHEMLKTANLAGAADFGTKAVIALSLLTGIPLGIAGHVVHSSIKKRKAQEEEAMRNLDYYRDAADMVEEELAQKGVEY